MAETPQDIMPPSEQVSSNAWELYTLAELGQWVHLLTKRAEHRTNFAKKDKDLQDASNYLAMMRSKLSEARTVNLEDFREVILRELSERCGVKEVSKEGEHGLASVSWIVVDDAPYYGFEATFKMFVQPAIESLVENLEEIDTIYELDSQGPVLETGSRTTVCTGPNMSVRLVTSYHVGKGLRSTIDIGIPKENS